MKTSIFHQHLKLYRKLSQGFTLLEVMIAISVISIALVTLFGSLSKSLSITGEAKFNTVAPMLARVKLAEIESGIAVLEQSAGSFNDGYENFSYRIDIDDKIENIPKTFEKVVVPLRRINVSVSEEGFPFTYQVTCYCVYGK